MRHGKSQLSLSDPSPFGLSLVSLFAVSPRMAANPGPFFRGPHQLHLERLQVAFVEIVGPQLVYMAPAKLCLKFVCAFVDSPRHTCASKPCGLNGPGAHLCRRALCVLVHGGTCASHFVCLCIVTGRE